MSKVEPERGSQRGCRECGAQEGHYMHCSHAGMQESFVGRGMAAQEAVKPRCETAPPIPRTQLGKIVRKRVERLANELHIGVNAHGVMMAEAKALEMLINEVNNGSA